MLGVMYVLVRRAFPVAFEWRRLAHLVVVVGGLTVLGADLLPDGSFAWFIARGGGVRAHRPGPAGDRFPASLRAPGRPAG